MSHNNLNVQFKTIQRSNKLTLSTFNIRTFENPPPQKKIKQKMFLYMTYYNIFICIKTYFFIG